MKRNLEETMQGLSAHMDGCDTRRCQDNVLFLRMLHNVAQERAFARSCLSRQKNTLVGMFNEIQRILKFRAAGVNLSFLLVLWFVLIRHLWVAEVAPYFFPPGIRLCD